MNDKLQLSIDSLSINLFCIYNEKKTHSKVLYEFAFSELLLFRFVVSFFSSQLDSPFAI